MKKEISYLIDEFISLSDELRPGYSLSIAKDKESSLILPESLNILYSKVSGTYYEIEDQRLMDFLPGYLLIRDAEYESFTQSVKEMIPNGEDKYYPILVNYSSDFYALKVSEGKENGIYSGIQIAFLQYPAPDIAIRQCRQQFPPLRNKQNLCRCLVEVLHRA